VIASFQLTRRANYSYLNSLSVLEKLTGAEISI